MTSKCARLLYVRECHESSSALERLARTFVCTQTELDAVVGLIM